MTPGQPLGSAHPFAAVEYRLKHGERDWGESKSLTNIHLGGGRSSTYPLTSTKESGNLPQMRPRNGLKALVLAAIAGVFAIASIFCP